MLSLVDVEKAHAAVLRRADLHLVSSLADAETRRINDLALLREHYDARIAADLAVNVRTTSDQLAGQLVKETSSLSKQIEAMSMSFGMQLGTLRAEIMPRLGELDKFRFESGGRTSVQDPATAEALRQMAVAVSSQRGAQDTSKGMREGMASLVGWIFGAIMTAVAITTLVYRLVGH